MKKSKKIYMDYASATPMEKAVISKMVDIMKANFANGSAIHDEGMKAKKILETAREEVAKILSAHKDEIIFTSGSTESNNLAIIGALVQFSEIFSHCALPGVPGGILADKKFQKTAQVPHIVTTNIEHSSVLEVCKYLEKTKQAEITYVPVEKNGIVDPKKIKKAIKPNTVLVSVMYANNEIGTIEPIQEIAKEIRHFKKTFTKDLTKVGPSLFKNEGPTFVRLPFFHTDATQAINYLPINVEKLGVDLMSFNSGKIYGPKGIGVLYKRRNVPLSKIIHGGSQEFDLRPGTENLANVIGLTEALKITEKIKTKEVKRLTKLRDYCIEKLFDSQKQNQEFSRVLGRGSARPLKNSDFVFVINGDLKNRLPNNINITIPKIPSDLLVIELSANGIYVSEKSACKSGDKASSYVIDAICSSKEKPNSLRISLGRQTTKTDIDYFLKTLAKILTKLKRWYN